MSVVSVLVSIKMDRIHVYVDMVIDITLRLRPVLVCCCSVLFLFFCVFFL